MNHWFCYHNREGQGHSYSSIMESLFCTNKITNCKVGDTLWVIEGFKKHPSDKNKTFQLVDCFVVNKDASLDKRVKPYSNSEFKFCYKGKTKLYKIVELDRMNLKCSFIWTEGLLKIFYFSEIKKINIIVGLNSLLK